MTYTACIGTAAVITPDKAQMFQEARIEYTIMQQRAAVIEPDHSSDSSGSCLNRIVKVGDNLKHDIVYVVESL